LPFVAQERRAARAPVSANEVAMNTLTSAGSVISSDRVTGTDVFNPAGDSLGSIDHLVIDKRSGQVVYAVMEFGGLLGLGSDLYPLPWSLLKYDVDKDGYVVPLEKEQLADAPRYRGESLRPSFDAAYGQEVHGHYKTPWVLL
jgi:hypothetical protein